MADEGRQRERVARFVVKIRELSRRQRPPKKVEKAEAKKPEKAAAEEGPLPRRRKPLKRRKWKARKQRKRLKRKMVFEWAARKIIAKKEPEPQQGKEKAESGARLCRGVRLPRRGRRDDPPDGRFGEVHQAMCRIIDGKDRGRVTRRNTN